MSKELIFSLTKKDFTITTFRSGGPGGQNQNKIESGVRIVHKESGVVAESREERSQFANKKIAFTRLCNNAKFKAWLRVETMRRMHVLATEKQIQVEVDRQVDAGTNLRLEIRDDNKWLIVPWDFISKEQRVE
jgi:protein subunit release factor A